MSDFETYRVCSNCFHNTITKNPPILERNYRDMKCNTCGCKWLGINVGYYSPYKCWYVIRPRPFNSEFELCRYKLNGRCYRDWRCRRAHNRLELEVWIEDERLLMRRKRPSKPKFGCIICKIDFRDNNTLNTHLSEREHITRTYNMRILPEVGSSIDYTGPIRTRPKPAYGKNSYELCRNYAKNNRCLYGSGCKHAHSREELRVWTDALTVEIYDRTNARYSQPKYGAKSESASGTSGSYSHSSQDGANRNSSDRSGSETPGRSKSRYRHSFVPGNFEEEPDHVKEVYCRINDFGIEPCLRNFPKHIQIVCNKSLTVTIDEKNKANELQWIFGLKATQLEYLNSVVLCDHRNMFRLGEIAKCSTKGAGKNILNLQNVPNRTNYLICQDFNSESYYEVILLCQPEVGAYKMQIIFQLKDDILVGKEIKVKTQGESFENARNNFRNGTKREPNIGMIQELLKVNWEHSFELLNINAKAHKYPMPINLEEKIKTGIYENVRDYQVIKASYVERFHELLYLEEFEHKSCLMKYDLQDQKITFNTVSKQITIENDYGRNYLQTAIGDTSFINFKLNHRLFEGYRSYRPPKLVYIIPNGTKKAYELKIFHTGTDYVIVSITTELIKACQVSRGLAQVRFTPEREDYVKMHEALESVNLSVLFPVHRRIQISRHWDVDHLLGRLDYEKELSFHQKVAVYSIIDSKFQSFPTIICGPFGCGKTRTLSIAARHITGAFYNSKVLIVTKTNSSANLYIELLQNDFDTITMLRKDRGNKKIMFRHFSMSRNINIDKSVTRQFANIEDGVYKGIRFFELKKCSIVVTTLLALDSLIPPKAREDSKFLFTHIFIDEAAQVIEPEACIALSLAGPSTKIALAGDVHQTRPLVLSKYGKKYNLDESLLERFEILPEYETEELYKCKVNLVENFRSQPLIVEFLSELFYEGSLIANPPSLVGPINFPALSFIHVSGDEYNLHGYPSFYNEEEAKVTIRTLRKLASCGFNVDKIVVLTTYKAQVRLIHEVLKEENLHCKREGHDDQYCRENNCVNNHTIEVRNLEGIQGREYDLVIVNTVRTIFEVSDDLPLEERLDLGLLDDVGQFNTILTRARGWVLVIGDVDCLTRVGECSNVWSKYVEKCQRENGFFGTCKDFEAFTMKIGNTMGNSAQIRSPRREEPNPNSDVSISSNPESLSENEKTVDKFELKFNLLQSFITTCHEELSTSTNVDVIQALNDQLDYAKLSIETIDRQRYIEQMCILSNYKPEDVPQEAANHLGSQQTANNGYNPRSGYSTYTTSLKDYPKI